MKHFVVLEHDWPTPHYDLMIEAGPTLRTWRLSSIPVAGQINQAEPIGNHRRDYLAYEGPVPGGRGQVRRIDAGTCSIDEDGPVKFVVQFSGGRLQGQMEFTIPAVSK